MNHGMTLDIVDDGPDYEPNFPWDEPMVLSSERTQEQIKQYDEDMKEIEAIFFRETKGEK